MTTPRYANTEMEKGEDIQQELLMSMCNEV
jgi:hypothetical protein